MIISWSASLRRNRISVISRRPPNSQTREPLERKQWGGRDDEYRRINSWPWPRIERRWGSVSQDQGLVVSARLVATYLNSNSKKTTRRCYQLLRRRVSCAKGQWTLIMLRDFPREERQLPSVWETISTVSRASNNLLSDWDRHFYSSCPAIRSAILRGRFVDVPDTPRTFSWWRGVNARTWTAHLLGRWNWNQGSRYWGTNCLTGWLNVYCSSRRNRRNFLLFRLLFDLALQVD